MSTIPGPNFFILSSSSGSPPATISLGLWKKTMFSSNAFKTSAAAPPSSTRATSTKDSLLCLRFIRLPRHLCFEAFQLGTGLPECTQAHDNEPDQHQGGNAVARPDVACMLSHAHDGIRIFHGYSRLFHRPIGLRTRYPTRNPNAARQA